MRADHERFLYVTAAFVARSDEPFNLLRVQSDRFLTQDVLARLDGFDRPFHVDVIGQRNIDRVDFRVGEQCLVTVVCDGQTVPGRGFTSLLRRSRRDALHPALWRVVHGNDNLVVDLRGAQDPPDDFILCHDIPFPNKYLRRRAR